MFRFLDYSLQAYKGLCGPYLGWISQYCFCVFCSLHILYLKIFVISAVHYTEEVLQGWSSSQTSSRESFTSNIGIGTKIRLLVYYDGSGLGDR